MIVKKGGWSLKEIDFQTTPAKHVINQMEEYASEVKDNYKFIIALKCHQVASNFSKSELDELRNENKEIKSNIYIPLGNGKIKELKGFSLIKRITTRNRDYPVYELRSQDNSQMNKKFVYRALFFATTRKQSDKDEEFQCYTFAFEKKGNTRDKNNAITTGQAEVNISEHKKYDQSPEKYEKYFTDDNFDILYRNYTNDESEK